MRSIPRSGGGLGQRPTSRVLVSGYGRMQGVVFRPGDARFVGKPADEAVRAVAESPGVVMVKATAGAARES